MKQPFLLQGSRHVDARGTLSFVNDFQFENVKRFYTIEHSDTKVIRAWQGHQKEEKWFYVIKGVFQVLLVKPDNWLNPSNELDVQHYVLNANNSQVLYIPEGFANGFRALESNSKLLIFSSFTVEESAADNFRFDTHKWYDWAMLE